MKISNALATNARLSLLLVATAACDSFGGGGAGGPNVRDSAGVAIVESETPRLPAGSWTLSPEPIVEILGEGPDVNQIPLDPVSIFEGPGRRIFVGDGNQVGWHAVLVYDSLGTFLHKMGGRGGGPGELTGQLWMAVPYRVDSVAVWDRRGPTIHVFGADGGFGRRVLLPEPPVLLPEGTMGFSSGFVGAFPDGAFLSYARGALEIPAEPGPAWYKHLLLEVAPEGQPFDSVGDFRFALYNHWDGREQTSTLIPHSVYELTVGNDLIRANSETYEYQVMGRDARVHRIVRKAAAPQPVTTAARDERVRGMIALYESSGRSTPEQIADAREMLESAPAPATMPLFTNVLAADDGHVWVERYRWHDLWQLPPDPQPTTWDVFSPDGEWVTEVVVPTRFLLRAVWSDRAYGVRIDELQVKHIVVYRIDRG